VQARIGDETATTPLLSSPQTSPLATEKSWRMWDLMGSFAAFLSEEHRRQRAVMRNYPPMSDVLKQAGVNSITWLIRLRIEV